MKMGLQTQTQTQIATPKPTRPSLHPPTLTTISTNGRQISYRGKNGNVLTIELKNSAKPDDLQSLTMIKKPVAEKSIAVMRPAVPATPGCVEVPSEGFFPEMFDMLSFWCMEAVEIAAFGPYAEVAAGRAA